MADVINTTYNGEFAGKYISAALLSANTLENGGLTIMPNIKFKSTMKRLSTDDLLVDATCDYVDNATVTLNERVLEPSEMQVNLTLCRRDFREDWDAISMGYSVWDKLPPTFEEYLIAYVGSKIAERCELNIWQGNGAVSGQHDGFVTLLTGAPIPVGQDLTGVAIDESNVIAELGRVADALPNSMYGKDDLYIYAPQNVIRAYVRALGGFAAGVGANGLNNQGTTWYNGNANALTFDGIKLFMANGLPNNTMVSSTVDNLFFGTGLMNDKNQVAVVDTSLSLGDQNIRMVWRFTAGVNYGNIEDIVAYGIN